MRANNEYLLSCYEKIRNENPGAIALDFGCGDGEIVAEAKSFHESIAWMEGERVD